MKKFFGRNPVFSDLTPVCSDRRRGQLLIESMIAITIISIGLLSALVLLYRSLSLNRVVGDQYVAANLAAEGVEIAKNIIDSNAVRGNRAWNAGVSDGCYEIDYLSRSLEESVGGSLKPLRFDAVAGAYSYEESGRPTAFTRKVCFGNSSDGEKIKVNSAVEWLTRGGGRFSVDAEDHFFNWRP